MKAKKWLIKEKYFVVTNIFDFRRAKFVCVSDLFAGGQNFFLCIFRLFLFKKSVFKVYHSFNVFKKDKFTILFVPFIEFHFFEECISTYLFNLCLFISYYLQ